MGLVMVKSLRDFIDDVEMAEIDQLDEIAVTPNGSDVQILREGKWISGRFDNNIRIDQPTYEAGQVHAHVLGRKGNELGIVNLDGTPSHGTKMRLHDADAEALKVRGFTIPPNGIVEWIVLPQTPTILFS